MLKKYTCVLQSSGNNVGLASIGVNQVQKAGKDAAGAAGEHGFVRCLLLEG